MRRIIIPLFLTLLSAVGVLAADDFVRERRGSAEKNAAKDALENKAPPPLQVTGWMNTKGKPLSLERLRGKVIVLDFWGVW